MIGAMIVSQLILAQEEQRAFDAMCEMLSPEDKEIAISERIRRMESELQHQRNMEVAREGRSLNFWGNR